MSQEGSRLQASLTRTTKQNCSLCPGTILSSKPWESERQLEFDLPLMLTDTCWVTIISEPPHSKPGWKDLYTLTLNLNSSIVSQMLVLQEKHLENKASNVVG